MGATMARYPELRSDAPMDRTSRQRRRVGPMPPTRKFNPAAYKPTTKVLRMVVRGRAGTRKTTFAASMAEAGLGPILFLDTERKVTNVRNWQTRFAETLTLTDAEAVEGAVDWLITDPDARALNLAGVIVDSW